jgi:protein TorT
MRTGWASSTAASARASQAARCVVAERHGDTGRAIQRRLVEAVLDEQPQLDYLVGNAPMAEAAIAELRRRGREGATAIVSSYLTPAVHGGILRGRILAAVTDFPVLQGRLAVRQALRALEGQPIEPYLGPAVELVDKSSLARFPVQWMLPPAGFRTGVSDRTGGALRRGRPAGAGATCFSTALRCRGVRIRCTRPVGLRV